MSGKVEQFISLNFRMCKSNMQVYKPVLRTKENMKNQDLNKPQK